jgi:enoyl-CoA hydratase
LIDVTKKDGLWQVTLNRPDKANALSPGAVHDLADTFERAAADPVLRGLIITGAGDRVFCAGADLGKDQDMKTFTRDPVWGLMSGRLSRLPCLTIAALNGTLAGGGFAIALACDIRICTPEAKFFYPVLKHGLLPQPDDVQRLSALIGPARAKIILIGGQKLDADEALACGLVNRVLPLGAFDDYLNGLLAYIMAAPPHHSIAIKRMFKLGLTAAELEECYSAVYDNAPLAIAGLMRPANQR